MKKSAKRVETQSTNSLRTCNSSLKISKWCFQRQNMIFLAMFSKENVRQPNLDLNFDAIKFHSVQNNSIFWKKTRCAVLVVADTKLKAKVGGWKIKQNKATNIAKQGTHGKKQFKNAHLWQSSCLWDPKIHYHFIDKKIKFYRWKVCQMYQTS